MAEMDVVQVRQRKSRKTVTEAEVGQEQTSSAPVEEQVQEETESEMQADEAALAATEAAKKESDEEVVPRTEAPDAPVVETQETISSVAEESIKEQESLVREMLDETSGSPVKIPKNEAPEKVSARKETERMLNQLSRHEQVFEENANLKGVKSLTKEEKRQIYSDNDVLPLGDELQYESHNASRKQDYLKLVAAYKNKMIQTGIITSVLTIKNQPCAIVEFGEFSVYIPGDKLISEAEEKALLEEKDLRERAIRMRKYVNQRIGSEVDYIVKFVDEKECIAGGDRREAMDLKKRIWYFAKDRHEEYMLHKGKKVEARVVESAAKGLTVEVYGMEFRLRENDIAYVRIPNIAAEYPTGTTVPVMFTSISRDKTDSGVEIHAKVTIKDAIPDPREREFNKWKLDALVTAVITGQDEFGMYARIGGIKGKQDMSLAYPQRSDRPNSSPEIPPIGTQVLARITKKTPDKYRIHGVIIRILS